MKRARGRPKKYDEDQAIAAAGQVFWTKGFSAASLDDLAEAMAMNRPSIYRAFGDKEAIYRKALQQFSVGMEAAFAATMLAQDDIREALTGFYRAALQVYTSGNEQKGCMVMSTAVAAATSHPDIQADLFGLINTLDEKFTERILQAQQAGQLGSDFSAADRAVLAQSLLHSLSLRARAGEAPERLDEMIENCVGMLVA